MPAAISLLRGVNVGGHNKIKMEELRELYESLGLRHARTYVQSGNVVFHTDARDFTRLSKRIADAIEHRFAFRPGVILRTAADLRAVIAANPFASRREVAPSRLLVQFLASEPPADARERVLRIETEPEELRMVGRELYIHYPNGIARPKVPWTFIERTLQTACTGRNWNTVRKLLEMAESLDAS
ncbi:MAG: DUF1697 domain-containing protein [Bryobacteraceae bacterium]